MIQLPLTKGRVSVVPFFNGNKPKCTGIDPEFKRCTVSSLFNTRKMEVSYLVKFNSKSNERTIYLCLHPSDLTSAYIFERTLQVDQNTII